VHQRRASYRNKLRTKNPNLMVLHHHYAPMIRRKKTSMINLLPHHPRSCLHVAFTDSVVQVYL
jgi:hypothetical protein